MPGTERGAAEQAGQRCACSSAAAFSAGSSAGEVYVFTIYDENRHTSTTKKDESSEELSGAARSAVTAALSPADQEKQRIRQLPLKPAQRLTPDQTVRPDFLSIGP